MNPSSFPNLQGIFPAMVTPFTDDGRVDTAKTRSFAAHLAGHGVHGLLLAGTTGEFYGLDPDGFRKLIAATKEAVDGRIPIVACTGGITTADTITRTRAAREGGADAAAVLTPMFVTPSDEELFQHYTAVADATDLPLLLYNNAPKTGVALSACLVERLAGIDTVIGIKDSSGDFTLGAEYLRRTRGTDFRVFAGRDTMIHAFLAYGAAGAIAACANVAPVLCVEIYEKHRVGDYAGALEAQFRLATLRMAFGLGTVPVVIKEALALRGLDCGPCLPPVQPLSGEAREKLRNILNQLEQDPNRTETRGIEK